MFDCTASVVWYIYCTCTVHISMEKRKKKICVCQPAQPALKNMNIKGTNNFSTQPAKNMKSSEKINRKKFIKNFAKTRCKTCFG